MKPQLIDAGHCTGCGACAASCNHEALKMQMDKNGFLHPHLVASKCIECGLCEQRCPILNISKLKFHSTDNMHCFASWSKNDDLCKRSSSGGVFSQIAINLLSQGNCKCFGANLTSKNICHHISISKIEELPLIAGTKYIQSDASQVYREIKIHLNKGGLVFFCGTPCQIAGLYAYLGYRNFDKLYTAELICHGVSSNITIEIACLYYQAEKIISFRDKKDGWYKLGRGVGVSQRMTYSINNKPTFINKDIFYNGGFANTHRKSCHSCPFAKIQRLADISLGDLLGWSKYYPERWPLGASLVLTNSTKGEILMHSGQLEIFEHPKTDLNCYTLFYPGSSAIMQFSEWMWLLKKLPIKLSVLLLTLDWKHNPLVLPFKILNYFAYKIHIRNTHRAIKQTKKKLGWQ